MRRIFASNGLTIRQGATLTADLNPSPYGEASKNGAWVTLKDPEAPADADPLLTLFVDDKAYASRLARAINDAAHPSPANTINEALLSLARRMRDVMTAFSTEDGDEADLFRRDIEAVLARAEGA
ncbi:MAG: hypothetical protein AB1592_13250 [Pseudomonadota bacterium]